MSSDLHSLIDATCSTLEGLSPAEHGFAFLDADHAHAQAEASRGGRLGGWLIPAKDLSDVAGLPTALGNAHRAYLPQGTDPFLAALQRQGAILFGKSQTSELGLSAYTEPVGAPAPTNPRSNSPLTPGGSSGGAAVMVARGLVRAAHGSDGGGSIRVPAACCGIVGFKPAHDTSGANPVAQGFLTATLEDSAFLHHVPQAPVRPLRVGVLAEPLHAPEQEVADHILGILDRAATALGHIGVEVVAIPRPYGSDPYGSDAYRSDSHESDSHNPDPFAAFATVLEHRAGTIPEAPEEASMTSWLRERSRHHHPDDFARAAHVFAQVPALLRRKLDVDLILSPVLAYDPPAVGTFSSLDPAEDFVAQTRFTPWCTMFNMSGGPSLSFPLAAPESRLGFVNLQLGAIRDYAHTTPQIFALAKALQVRLGSVPLCPAS